MFKVFKKGTNKNFKEQMSPEKVNSFHDFQMHNILLPALTYIFVPNFGALVLF